MAPTPRGPSERTLIEVLSALSRGATRYEDDGEIARGGMGSIHRVWDRDLRRPLAMKRYLGELDLERDAASDSSVDPSVARFVEEAQVTGQLDHPGIVPVHELGLDDSGRLFFTMRLVEGHTLGEVFELARDESDERWTPTRVLRTLVRVCEAVAYAHSRGVVHRDLKPANVMVGQFGEVYVMDWGLAKVVGGEERPAQRAEQHAEQPSVRTDRAVEAATTRDSHLLTLEGNVLGTPAYMPPEQARGRLQDLGPRSDVYALGAILYEFLTGAMPYVRNGEDATAHGILRELIEGPPTPIAELRPDAPEELVEICEKAMARDPRARFADSLELGEALSRFFERPVTQARRGLQRSRLVTATQWTLGCAFWAVCSFLLLILTLALVAQGDSAVSVSVPLKFEVVAPSWELGSEHPWVRGLELDDLEGNLVVLSSHWLARLAILSTVAVVLLFLLFVIHQARRILAAVRRGEPFTVDNLRRIRRVGVALVALGLLRTVHGPLMSRFASEYLSTDGLVIRQSLDFPFRELLGAALVFILAEVFRVGTELEKRQA